MTTQERKAQLKKLLATEEKTLHIRHEAMVSTRADYDEAIAKVDALKKEQAVAADAAKDALASYQGALEAHSQSMQVISKLKGELMQVTGSETAGVSSIPA